MWRYFIVACMFFLPPFAVYRYEADHLAQLLNPVIHRIPYEWLLLLPVVIAGIAGLASLKNRLDHIASLLTLAEREFNDLYGAAHNHKSRRERVKERYEWNRLNKTFVAAQTYMAGYRSPQHDLIMENEAELQGKRKSAGRAGLTGFLLREIYQGSVSRAQHKIMAETANNNGQIPHIVGGLREIVGMDSFDGKTFPQGSGVDPTLLQITVWLWDFPREVKREHLPKADYNPPSRTGLLRQFARTFIG